MKMLPSSANSVRPPMRQATVLSKLFFDTIGFGPVCMSMKQPVPYVFFTMPGRVQHWPKRAACWSPAMPAMGILPPSRLVSPKTSLEPRTSGSTLRGTLNSFSNSASQSPVRRLYSIVREALLASVTCTVPPVSFQMSQVSMVPNASRPCRAKARAPFTCLSSHAILVAEK